LGGSGINPSRPPCRDGTEQAAVLGVANVDLSEPVEGGWDDPGVQILCALASVYADHADYQEEWKP